MPDLLGATTQIHSRSLRGSALSASQRIIISIRTSLCQEAKSTGSVVQCLRFLLSLCSVHLNIVCASRRAERVVDSTFASRVGRMCGACGDTLPRSFFSAARKGRSSCRTCVSHYNRQRAAASPARLPPTKKTCSHCCRLLPAGHFSRSRQNLSGLHSQCKDCALERGQAYRALNAAAPVPLRALAATKPCYSCKEELARAAFSEDAGRWDGLQSECKRCERARLRKRTAGSHQADVSS